MNEEKRVGELPTGFLYKKNMDDLTDTSLTLV